MTTRGWSITRAWLIGTGAVVASGLMAFPVYWLVGTSVAVRKQLYVYPPRLIPEGFSLSSYVEVITQFPVLRWMWNTAVVAGSTAVVSVILAALAAYSLSRFRFPGRWTVHILILTTQMIPATLLVIPIYLMFMHARLLDSHVGLVVAYVTFSLPFCVWMLRGFFDTIPVELDEAAMIDGCSRARALFSVILPLAAPGMAATALFAFIMGWDEYLLARVLLATREKWVASTGISSFSGQYGTFYDQIAAAGFLISLPVIGLFLYLQKHLVAGLTQGAVKG